jgi:HPt (histidine-containing phosphotransfer) domain-containing protein
MNSVASQSYSNESTDQFRDEEELRPHSSKPIDLVHLSRQTFGSKELENEVLGLFVSHSQQCLGRLKTAETNKEWRDILHTIKGSARAIGAWKTANLAEDYEQKIEQLSADEKITALNDMQCEIKTTVSYIEGLI